MNCSFKHIQNLAYFWHLCLFIAWSCLLYSLGKLWISWKCKTLPGELGGRPTLLWSMIYPWWLPVICMTSASAWKMLEMKLISVECMHYNSLLCLIKVTNFADCSFDLWSLLLSCLYMMHIAIMKNPQFACEDETTTITHLILTILSAVPRLSMDLGRRWRYCE